jgi:molecular chaperone HscB
MPASFLVQQMEWREALDDADTVEQVEAIAREVAERKQAAFDELRQTLDERHDTRGAAEQVRALMFVERFGDDVDHRLEALGQ